MMWNLRLILAKIINVKTPNVPVSKLKYLLLCKHLYLQCKGNLRSWLWLWGIPRYKEGFKLMKVKL